MDIYSMTEKAICAEIGSRLKKLRLRRNITQQQLAKDAAVSLNVVKALEQGRGKLSSLVAILRELGGLDELDQFIPETEISPLQLARNAGKERKRASGSHESKSQGSEVEW